MSTAILLNSCPDQRGVIAKIANFIYVNGGNILHADHHRDVNSATFLSRIEWDLEGFRLKREEISTSWEAIAQGLEAKSQLHFSDEPRRIAIWVSRQEHCLLDLLFRCSAGEFPNAEVKLIISNHTDLKPIAEQLGIDFYYIPVTPETKTEAEHKQIELLEQYQIDLVVLAKYMQILSPEFTERFPQQIINIHHSFLPAFPGAKPYHKAASRGVKLIGATAHYVTSQLDEGPIIEQEVTRVTHRDGVKDLIRKGKDLERIVLARAVRLHLQNRVLVYRDRTIIF